jgi:acylphosphatase
MRVCMHCIVSGKVQGVWFRANTQTQAQQLQVNGWVKNLANGRVEVFACGDEEQLELLFQWLRVGPELAKVEEVSRELVEWQEFTDFIIK